MKPKIIVFSSVIAALLIFSSYTIYEGGEDKPEVLLKLITQGMNYYHYQPQEFDDQFSAEVYDQYLKRLDPAKRFLTEEDIQTLKKYRFEIDDELEMGTFEFFDTSVKMFNARKNEVRAYYKEILSQSFDFKQDEAFDADPDKMGYAANSEALKNRWRKALKYQTLFRLSTSIEVQEKAKEKSKGDEDLEIKSPAVMEEEAREKVLKNHDAWFTRMDRESIKDKRAEYINAITTTFDPHTEYFPPKDKQTFDIRISGKLEGIGALLTESDGYIKVSRIVPGSASSRQGQLEVNDKILKVAQGDEEPVDVVDMNLDDAVLLVRGKKGTEVRLTVQKLDGSIVVIPIIRDIVVLEETYAKSAILKTEGTDEGIGYIHLPKFYFDFNDSNGRRCATDVANEIKKLKAENINSLILDLRNNGGGSLSDVVEMAGLFIEEGPVVQVKSRQGAPRILADRDPKVQYDGNLVVLVNSISASASEILAAAIQDYKRGIIVGSPSTFGKGTVQRFVDLDDLIRGSYEIKPLGEVKLTTQKFYRISGGATQLKGVIPDIVLPDEYSLLDIGEKEHDHSMAWDEISPVPYESWDNEIRNISKIKSNSMSRINASPTFQLIQENAERLKKRQDQYSYTLNLEDYLAERKRLKEEAEKYDNIDKDIDGFYAIATSADQKDIEADGETKKRYDNWYKSIKKDVYLFEAVHIIRDMK